MLDPCRGDIWYADLDPIRGHEQGERRPCLVISSDHFNTGKAELVVIAPLTTNLYEIPLRVSIEPPEGGIRGASSIMCDQIRTIDKSRLSDRWGAVTRETMREVERRLYLLLDLRV